MFPLDAAPSGSLSRAAKVATRSDATMLSDYVYASFVGLLSISILWPRYVYLPVGGFGANPYTIGNIVALIGGFVLLFRDSRLYTKWRVGITRAAMVATLFASYVVWRLVCDLMGETPYKSTMDTLRDAAYTMSPFVIGSVMFLDRRSRETVPIILCGCAAVASALGIYEHIAEQSIVMASGIARFAVDENPVELISTWGGVRDGGYRAASVFVHPLVFGQFVAALTPVAVVLLLKGKGVVRMVALAQIALAPGAIYASGTRSPVFVLLAGMAAFASLTICVRRSSAIAKIGLLLSLVVIGASIYLWAGDYFNELVAGRSEDEIQSSEGRRDMIDVGMSVAESSPIFGFGDGLAPSKAGLSDAANGSLTIDNTYLSVMLDFGYVGLAIFVALSGAIVRLGMRSAAKAASLEDRRLSIALASTIVAILVGQYVLSISSNLSLFYLAAGYFVAVLAVSTSGKRVQRLGLGRGT